MVEGHVLEKHPFYYPATILAFVKKGAIHLDIDNQETIVQRGEYVLINKYTQGLMHKSWTAEEGEARIFCIMLEPKFVEKVKQSFHKNQATQIVDKASIFILKRNHILKGLFDSIATYVEEGQELDTQLVELKTQEAMMGVLKFHPECISFFEGDADAEKVDIRLVVENSYMFNLTVQNLAELSGRSLSTFVREFKSIYNNTPHKWRLKRRLHQAQEILLSTQRKPAEFYLELGFESLAHFSRAFKKEFGLTLTDFRKNRIVD